MTDPKTGPDWERIEGDYRAGVLSLREIAAKDGNVTEGAIRKRAKRDGWTRDLKAKIDARAEDLVRKQAVRNQSTHEGGCAPSAVDKATEREIIEANATQIAKVRDEHRVDIRRARNHANRLMSALEGLEIAEAPSVAATLAKAGTETSGSSGEPPVTASMKEHTIWLRTLAETLKVLVGLEREAYGLAHFTDPPTTPQDIDPIQGAKAIAFILARGAAEIEREKGAAL